MSNKITKPNKMKMKPYKYKGFGNNIQYIPPKSFYEYDKNTPEIQNVVVMVNTFHKLDLRELCSWIGSSEYKLKKFAAAIARMYKTSTVLFYSTAKQVTAGSKSIYGAFCLSYLYLTIFGNIKIKVYEYDPKTLKAKKGFPKYIPLCRWLRFNKMVIANMVGRSIIDPKYIHLNEIHRIYKSICKYSPHTFPGLRVSIKNVLIQFPEFAKQLNNEPLKISGLIFSTGYVLVLGIKNTKYLKIAYEIMKKMILKAHDKIMATDSIRSYIWSKNNEEQLIKNTHDIESTDNEEKSMIIDTPYFHDSGNFIKRIESYLYEDNNLKYSRTDAGKKLNEIDIEKNQDIFDNFNIFSFKQSGLKLLLKNKEI